MAKRYNVLQGMDAMDIVNGAIGEGALLPATIPADALVKLPDGSYQYKGFVLSRTALQTSADITEDEWMELGQIIGMFESSVQWWLGDWFLTAERKWKATYEQVAARTGYAVRTLHDFAYVARSVDVSIRIETLTWGHHQVVAGLDPASQRAWLEHAAANGLSIAKLRAAINPALGDGNRKDPALKKATQYAGYITNELPGLSEAGATTAGLIEQRARFLADFYAQVAKQAATRKRQAKDNPNG